jgi:hypothetical protein
MGRPLSYLHCRYLEPNNNSIFGTPDCEVQISLSAADRPNAEQSTDELVFRSQHAHTAATSLTKRELVAMNVQDMWSAAAWTQLDG